MVAVAVKIFLIVREKIGEVFNPVAHVKCRFSSILGKLHVLQMFLWGGVLLAPLKSNWKGQKTRNLTRK